MTRHWIGGLSTLALVRPAPETTSAGRGIHPRTLCRFITFSRAAFWLLPKTDSGNCYGPGEFCRTSDHGMSGIAGNGEAIICEDNNGWRWEPA